MPAPNSMLELQNLIKNIVVVDGTTVTFNFADVSIKDNIIQLNKSDNYDLNTGTAGIEIDRLTDEQVMLLWDEAVKAFKLQKGQSLTDINFRKHQTGWKDLVGIPVIPQKALAGTAPLWMDTGNGFWAYSFSDEIETYVYSDFHQLHDIKIGSKMYPHIHWMPTSNHTGNVVWKIEYVHAKGHAQQESLSTQAGTTIYIVDSGNGIIGEHIVSETSESDAFIAPEIDSIIRFKVSRDVDNPLDTYYGNVFLLLTDLHYEADRIASLNKSPDFYGADG